MSGQEHQAVIAVARRLAGLSSEEAPAAEAQQFGSDDGTAVCRHVYFWASEEEAQEDAENGEGAPGASAEVLFSEKDPDGTVTIHWAKYTPPKFYSYKRDKMKWRYEWRVEGVLLRGEGYRSYAEAREALADHHKRRRG